MKVLFICSGNKSGGPGIIVSNQAESLQREGLRIEYYPLFGEGIKGYFWNYFRLRKFVKKNQFDIYHAHYGLSGILTFLCGCKPLLVSLMGSDILKSGFASFIIKQLIYLDLFDVIVKTNKMRLLLKNTKVRVVPNGVNINRFKPMLKTDARMYLGFPDNKKYILFMSNPVRPEKNYHLAVSAVALLNDKSVEIITIYDQPNEKVPYYLNMSDVLILTSLWEGSVNVIKEAMACNLPIVSTDVGDVKEIIKYTEGCHITSFDKYDVANKLGAVLALGKRTNGRQRIIELGLDSESIAKSIIRIYNDVLSKNYSDH